MSVLVIMAATKICIAFMDIITKMAVIAVMDIATAMAITAVIAIIAVIHIMTMMGLRGCSSIT